MLAGFKKFISRGNMIDMAVAVVMGSAVTKVVNAVAEHFINPLIAMIFGQPDMSELLKFTYNNATISFGAILTAILNFFIVAIAVYFCIIMPINKFRDLSSTIIRKVKGVDGKDEEGGSGSDCDESDEKDGDNEKAEDGEKDGSDEKDPISDEPAALSANEEIISLLTDIRNQLAKSQEA